MGFNPSKISNLAFKIFSLLPKLPIWAVPTLVITATSGLAIFVKYEISPRWFIPISSTNTSLSSSSDKIVKGKPIWLFWLPIVLWALYFSFKTL